MGHELDIRRIAREEAEKVVAGTRGIRYANADKLQNRLLSAKAPTNQYYLGWNNTTKKWEPVGMARAVKGSSQTFTQESTTLQDITDLVFAVGASETWIFEFFVSFQSGTTPDIKFSVIAPSGATIRWGMAHFKSTTVSTPVYSVLTTGEDDIQALTGIEGTHIMGTIVNSTTAGDLQLQGAQNTSDASNTTIHANSWVMGHQIP